MTDAVPQAPRGPSAGAGKPIGRRVFFAVLGLGAAGIAVGGDLQRGITKALSSVPSAGVAGLVPGAGGFEIYTVSGGYPVPPPGYRLHVGGLVDHPASFAVEELRALPATHLDSTFQCVTGWSVRHVHWSGVRLVDLADAVSARPEATAFELRSFDGVYTESLTRPQAQASGAVVAYDMLGAPVSRPNGGPLRLFVPGMFGYKSIKWLSNIDLVDKARPGYWEQRGYPVNAWIAGAPPGGAAAA
ncbi:MAG: molybdopterin-dependent oxidoreductase [Acidimicrobiales bacterium]